MAKEKLTYQELENQITELKKQNEILKSSKSSIIDSEEKFSNIFDKYLEMSFIQ